MHKCEKLEVPVLEAPGKWLPQPKRTWGEGKEATVIEATEKAMYHEPPCQSCCHGLWFASLMLHSALLFGHPPNLAGFADRFVLVLERIFSVKKLRIKSTMTTGPRRLFF